MKAGTNEAVAVAPGLTPESNGGRDLGTISKHGWQAERSRRLQRICLSAERQMKEGRPLRRALKGCRHYLKGRAYRCEPGRRIRLGGKTLARVYYSWKRAGRNPEAFTLNYRPGLKRRISKGEALDLVLVCINSGARSLREGYDKGNLPVTYSSLWRAIPVSVRKGLRRLFESRRKVEILQRQVVRALVAEEGRQ